MARASADYAAGFAFVPDKKLNGLLSFLACSLRRSSMASSRPGSGLRIVIKLNTLPKIA